MSNYRLKMTKLLWRDSQAFYCFVVKKEQNISFVTKCCQRLSQGGRRKVAAFVEVIWESLSCGIAFLYADMVNEPSGWKCDVSRFPIQTDCQVHFT